MITAPQEEFRSRTQKPLQEISVQALKARTWGISAVRKMISEGGRKNADFTRELIATMNYGVSQCAKEMKRREKAK